MDNYNFKKLSLEESNNNNKEMTLDEAMNIMRIFAYTETREVRRATDFILNFIKENRHKLEN